ncbi:MAG TPA: hypothetical protein VF014_00070 [Casimicrobiaceae bacterium]|nr:hypothetical protein [Casimicrobiaceae bacterium]
MNKLNRTLRGWANYFRGRRKIASMPQPRRRQREHL